MTEAPTSPGQVLTVAGAYLFVVLSWAPKLGIYLSRRPHLGAFSRRVPTRTADQAAVEADGLKKPAWRISSAAAGRY